MTMAADEPSVDLGFSCVDHSRYLSLAAKQERASVTNRKKQRLLGLTAETDEHQGRSAYLTSVSTV